MDDSPPAKFSIFRCGELRVVSAEFAPSATPVIIPTARPCVTLAGPYCDTVVNATYQAQATQRAELDSTLVAVSLTQAAGIRYTPPATPTPSGYPAP